MVRSIYAGRAFIQSNASLNLPPSTLPLIRFPPQKKIVADDGETTACSEANVEPDVNVDTMTLLPNLVTSLQHKP